MFQRRNYQRRLLRWIKIKTHSITKTNELFYAGAVVVTNRIGVKIYKVGWRKKPVCKRRFQKLDKRAQEGLSQLEASKDKDISNFSKIRKKIQHQNKKD